VIAEYNASDTLLRKFIFGPGLDEPIAMIDVDGATETWYFYHGVYPRECGGRAWLGGGSFKT
jgi:hypothetical protein